MYKLHLILKYLRKRRIAWVSLIAVMLCTAMVLVVISVMGGWLRMFEESFHGLSGDIIVQAKSLRGFPHYQEMIGRIDKLPEVEAAVPTIRTYGLINIGKAKTDGVQVFGYPLRDIGKVNRFPQSLYRQYKKYLDEAADPSLKLTEAQRQALRKKAEENVAAPTFAKPFTDDLYNSIVPKSSNWPGMIAGAGVLDIRKGADGKVIGRDDWKLELPVKLVVMNVNSRSFSDPGATIDRPYWIADDSRTQIWQYDSNTVYVPFDLLQKDLGMDAQTVTSDTTGQTVTKPARTSDIHIRVKAGVPLEPVKIKIQNIVKQVMAEGRERERLQGVFFTGDTDPVVETWRESQAMWIGAIENEKILVVFLFSLISVVAIFLIFCIFYMIVVEKTKDIGIIKSVGATSSGVAGIFLGYGMAIGIVGAGLGLLAGYLIVHNINYLHQMLGQLMGIQIWKPEVYAFDTIPNTMDPKEVSIIVAIAILSSILGALVPAIRAARMQPVESLRWE